MKRKATKQQTKPKTQQNTKQTTIKQQETTQL